MLRIYTTSVANGASVTTSASRAVAIGPARRSGHTFVSGGFP